MKCTNSQNHHIFYVSAKRPQITNHPKNLISTIKKVKRLTPPKHIDITTNLRTQNQLKSTKETPPIRIRWEQIRETAIRKHQNENPNKCAKWKKRMKEKNLVEETLPIGPFTPSPQHAFLRSSKPVY